MRDKIDWRKVAEIFVKILIAILSASGTAVLTTSCMGCGPLW